jgi:YHS domain-containing protein
MPTDPVCGMEVSPVKTRWRSEYEGQVFYFCSKACKEAFDRDPERYAGVP